MNKKSNKIRRITGLGILTALTIGLQFFANYVTFTVVNVNLALVSIIIGACLYGPIGGLWLGLVDGAIICAAPATLALFMPYNAFATVLLCLLKTGIAGLVSGFVYKLLKNKNEWIAIILASILLPIINTGLFTAGSLTIFYGLITNKATEAGYENAIKFFFVIFISVNFFFELAIVTVLAPTVHKVIEILKNKIEIQNNEDVEVE